MKNLFQYLSQRSFPLRSGTFPGLAGMVQSWWMQNQRSPS